ncbi:MAG: FeoB small GTPase domain-containing protein [Christensenellales bacterium]|jgi:ferrous iron transport protein B
MSTNATVALLSQPNAGKSTLFNGLTGAKQHVGNWPGKTVEKKEGTFQHKGKSYSIIDLPGSYCLSANSNEEIVTRDYIASRNADLVCILADASQLERSLFMLADYAGITAPVILVLNMIDVAKEQGKTIDSKLLSERLGIPVVAMSAANLKEYDDFLDTLNTSVINPHVLNTEDLTRLYEEKIGEPFTALCRLLPKAGIEGYSQAWLAVKLIENDAVIKALVESIVDAETTVQIEKLLSAIPKGNLLTGECKFKWIESVLDGAVKQEKQKAFVMSKFDRAATSRRWGKWIALGVILVGADCINGNCPSSYRGD